MTKKLDIVNLTLLGKLGREILKYKIKNKKELNNQLCIISNLNSNTKINPLETRYLDSRKTILQSIIKILNTTKKN